MNNKNFLLTFLIFIVLSIFNFYNIESSKLIIAQGLLVLLFLALHFIFKYLHNQLYFRYTLNSVLIILYSLVINSLSSEVKINIFVLLFVLVVSGIGFIYKNK